MSSRFLSIVTLSLCTTATLLLQSVARADVPLTRAEVRDLYNQVRLILEGRAPQKAQKGTA